MTTLEFVVLIVFITGFAFVPLVFAKWVQTKIRRSYDFFRWFR